MISKTKESKVLETIKKARSLKDTYNGNKTELFVQQAKVLADCEDDFEYNGEITSGNCYEDLDDSQLRYYISWRTKWRQGEQTPAPEPFVLIYVSELVNRIGCADANEAYNKVIKCKKVLGKVSPLCKTTIIESIRHLGVYFNLDLNQAKITKFDEVDQLQFFFDLKEKTETEIFNAILKIIEAIVQSPLYKAHPDLETFVIANVLRKMEERDSAEGKIWFNNYFGEFTETPITFFSNTLFLPDQVEEGKKIVVSIYHYYQYKNRAWYLYEFAPYVGYRKTKKVIICSVHFINLLIAMDTIIRNEINFRFKTDIKVTDKWLLNTTKKLVKEYNETHKEVSVPNPKFPLIKEKKRKKIKK